MIGDSVPWKDDLKKVADRLEVKSKQKRWTERTGYLIERDFMMSAYVMRRLLDAHKISDALRQRQVLVTRFALIGEVPDLLSPFEIWDSYDFTNGQPKTLSLLGLCQRRCHSVVATNPLSEGGAGWRGGC